MVRLLLGIVKGAVVGGGVGYGAYALGLHGGWGYLVYGVIGFLVGLLVGRPVWSHMLDKSSTIWTSVLKGIFGFGIGVGLYALLHKVWDPSLTLQGITHTLTDWTFLFGGAVGAIYGAFLELDDAPEPKKPGAAKPAK
jgi:hypothetical protein